MTRDQIITRWELLTTRERDGWIAEVIFGMEVHGGFYNNNGVRVFYPFYTSDISAAWKVVEQMHSIGFRFDMSTKVLSAEHPVSAAFDDRECLYIEVDRLTAPEAICLSALIARLKHLAEK